MVVSERLVYDDGGYFIQSRSGQWEPRYNFYEYPNGFHLLLELSGFKKGELKTLIGETSIAVSGIRKSFETQTTLITHASQIPTGAFNLDIPLKHRIDRATIKTERTEDFIIITASKTNLDAQSMDI